MSRLNQLIRDVAVAGFDHFGKPMLYAYIITSLLRMSEMVAPLATEVVRPYCDSGMLTMLPLKLDLRLGPAGIITLREHRPSPAANAMLTALREAAATPRSPKTSKAKRPAAAPKRR